MTLSELLAQALGKRLEDMHVTDINRCLGMEVEIHSERREWTVLTVRQIYRKPEANIIFLDVQ